MDVERTIELLLAQQARFAEQQAKHDARISELQTHLVNLAQSEERTNAIIEVLAERQVKTEEELSDLTEKVTAVTESVQSLIQLFERHIAQH